MDKIMEYLSEYIPREVKLLQFTLSPQRWYVIAIFPFLHFIYIVVMMARGQINAIVFFILFLIPYLIFGNIAQMPLWAKSLAMAAIYASASIYIVEPEAEQIPRLWIPASAGEIAVILACGAIGVVVGAML